MSTWIGLLRAVNLGARRKFPPPAIAACAEGLGFTDVATHINSGNVFFRTTLRSRERITGRLEAAFAADRGFEVPVVLLSPAELRTVAQELDEVGAGHPGQHHVAFLQVEPTDAVRVALEGLEPPGERAVVRGRAVHLLLGERAHSSRLSNAVVERYAGTATARNRRVVEAMATKWA